MLSSTLFSDFNAIPTNKNHQILSSPSVYRIGGLVYLPTWSMTNDDQLPAAANDAFFFQFVLVWRRCWIAKWEQNFCPSAMRPFLFFRFCREKWSHNNRTISWRDKLWRCDDAEADFVVNGWMTDDCIATQSFIKGFRDSLMLMAIGKEITLQLLLWCCLVSLPATKIFTGCWILKIIYLLIVRRYFGELSSSLLLISDAEETEWTTNNLSNWLIDPSRTVSY